MTATSSSFNSRNRIDWADRLVLHGGRVGESRAQFKRLVAAGLLEQEVGLLPIMNPGDRRALCDIDAPDGAATVAESIVSGRVDPLR